MPRGRKPGWMDERRKRWLKTFDLTVDQASNLTVPLLEQLDRCKSDLERRLLLGRTRTRKRKKKDSP